MRCSGLPRDEREVKDEEETEAKLVVALAGSEAVRFNRATGVRGFGHGDVVELVSFYDVGD